MARLAPLDVVRETSSVIRLRWRPLLLLAVARIGLNWAVPASADRIIGRAQTFSVSLMVTNAASGYISFWVDGFIWMMMAVVVANAIGAMRGGLRGTLRSILGLSGRWAVLAVLLLVLAGAVFIAGMLPGMLFGQGMSPGFLRIPAWLVNETANHLMEAALAYVLFAPLALALDSASIGTALVVSWRRVRGSWLRVCGTAILLWIPYGVLRVAFRYVPSSPVATVSGVIIRGLAWSFLLVGAALMYIRLALAQPEDVPASERAESGPPVAGLRPLAP